MQKNFIKIVIASTLTIILSVTIALLIGIYNNNRNVEAVSAETLSGSYDRAIDWLIKNEELLLQKRNFALWWMIYESSLISDDNRIDGFYDRFYHAHLFLRRPSIWFSYFYDDYRPSKRDLETVSSLNDYQQFFAYGFSCDDQLAEQINIQAQFSPDYCGLHFLKPRCVTHQQMAVRLLIERGCGDHENLSKNLLDTIEQQITYDFRVTDSYLQRALMLTEGGRPLKNIWIERIIENQNEDGGWADYYEILGSGPLSLGTGSTRFKTGPQPSDFHATAQAIWLLTMLLEERLSHAQ